MGVEWELGCEHCQRFVWLGSQKPGKWEGFQMGNDYVERFFSLHTHGEDRPCTLLLSNDGSADAPWEAENAKNSDWQEDILSRRFWNSFKEGKIVCAQCEKQLSEDWTKPPHGEFVRASRGLWFCSHAHQQEWVAGGWKKDYADAGYDQFAPHDSSKEKPVIPDDSVLVVGCQDCKSFVPVDGMMLSQGEIRDFEYLAWWMGEHLKHRLQVKFVVAGEN